MSVNHFCTTDTRRGRREDRCAAGASTLGRIEAGLPPPPRPAPGRLRLKPLKPTEHAFRNWVSLATHRSELTDGRKLIFFLPAPQKQIRIPTRGTSGGRGRVAKAASSLEGRGVVGGGTPAPAALSPEPGMAPGRLKRPGCRQEAGPGENALELSYTPPPFQHLKAGCNFARGDQTASQGRCQEQNEIPNKLAMSEKPIQHRIKAHKGNTIYSAYLVRILNNPAPSFSPRAEPSDGKGQSGPRSERGGATRLGVRAAQVRVTWSQNRAFTKGSAETPRAVRGGEMSPRPAGKHMRLAHV